MFEPRRRRLQFSLRRKVICKAVAGDVLAGDAKARDRLAKAQGEAMPLGAKPVE
jgi:hypothetical protein